jgi:hypothetical protein
MPLAPSNNRLLHTARRRFAPPLLRLVFGGLQTTGTARYDA